MCNYLFVAADQPLPALAWDEAGPAVHIGVCVQTDLATVRHWFTKCFIYDVGSHTGCGCPFCYESKLDRGRESDSEWRQSRDQYRQLAVYLEGAVALAGSVELYNAWDYWEPPLIRRRILVQDLLGDTFLFEERELLTVSSSPSEGGRIVGSSHE